jgi:hypothetical protein
MRSMQEHAELLEGAQKARVTSSMLLGFALLLSGVVAVLAWKSIFRVRSGLGRAEAPHLQPGAVGVSQDFR